MSAPRNVPDDRRYTPNHIWVRKDGEMCKAGITDYAQDQLGQVVFVELPESGSGFDHNQEFGTIESVKTVSQLMMPISGSIDASNSALEDDPSLANNDCYGKGWLVRIMPTDWAEYENLLDAEAYRRLLLEGE